MPPVQPQNSQSPPKQNALEEIRQDLARLQSENTALKLEKNFLERAMGDLNFHNNAHDGVVYTDAENHIVYANPYFLEMMGIAEKAEILEQPFPDYMWNDDTEAVRLFADIRGDGFVREREMALYNQEGKPVFAMCSGVASRDEDGNVIGAEIMFCNITSKRTFQAELVEQHALLDAMLESTPDPVFILDSELQLKRCNPTAEALFPDRKCGSGLPVLELFGENGLDADKLEILQSKFTAEELFDLELNFGERHFDMHAGPLRSQHKGWVCVLHDITARKRTEEQLQYVAFHDAMTKLPNRAYFIEKLERMVTRAKQEPSYTFALLFIDLDRLKLVNDNHGHHAGDQVLTEFARRLEACIRPGDLVCRLGGDEFAIFLDNIQGRETAEQVTQRIYESLQRPFTLNGGTPTQATASVGIAFSGDETMDLDALLRQADGAMYQVKEGGGDGFLVYGDH